MARATMLGIVGLGALVLLLMSVLLYGQLIMQEKHAAVVAENARLREQHEKSTLDDQTMAEKIHNLTLLTAHLSQENMELYTKMRKMDHSQDKFQEEEDSKKIKELHTRLEKLIFDLQNPKDCTEAKYLVCPIDRCGFGCGIHRLTWCMTHAVHDNRVAVMLDDSGNFPYGQFHEFFNHLSPCHSWFVNTSYEGMQGGKNYEVMNLQESPWGHHEFIPAWLTEEFPLKDTMVAFFIGHLTAWVIKPNKATLAKVNEQMLAILGNTVTVDFGIHVRRGDKLVSEAQKYELREYMNHVDHLARPHQMYHNHYEGNYESSVFIATDDPNVINELHQSYSYYTLFDNTFARTAARESGDGLIGVLVDLYIMKNARYFIGTFSSQIGRLVYELMMAEDGRADARCHSLDSAYFAAM